MAKSYEELKASVKGTSPQKKTYAQLRDELTSKYGLTPRTDDSDFAKKYSSDLVSRANSLKSLQYDESNAESTLSRLNKEWIDISGRRHRADDYYKTNMSDVDFQRYTANADNVANAYQSAIANVKSYINKQNSISTKLNKVVENNNSQIEDIQSLYDRVAEGDSSALAELKKRNLDTVEKADAQVRNLANESAQLQRSSEYYSLMENAMNQKDFDNLKDSMIAMPKASGSLAEMRNSTNPSALGTYNALNKSSDEMFYTPEEKEVYRYYKAKEESGEIEEGTADKFFNLIGEQHNIREGSLVGQFLNQNPVLQYATPVAKGLFYDVPKNIANLGNLKDDYILPTSVDVASSAVRDDLGTVGKVVYDVLNTTANMIPTIAVSYITGNPALGIGVMSAESAGSNYAEKLNSGMNKAQAYGLSLLQGVWEGVSEYYLGGIETLSANKLGGLVSRSALADGIRRGTNGAVRGILRFGADMATEGLEEVIQDLGSSIIDGIVTNKWEFSSLDDLAYSFTLGALSAGALNGATNAMRRAGEYSTAKAIKTDAEKVEALKKIGSTFSADSVAYKLAGKVDANTGAFTLSRMIHDLNANLSEQNQRSIEHELTERGVADSDARTISKWLAKAVDGDYFTEKEAMLLEKNPVISEVYYKTIIDDNSTVNQRLANLATLNDEEYIRKDYSTDDAQNLEDAKKRISEFQSNTLGRRFVKADTSDIRSMADNFAKEYNGLSNIGEAVNYESRNDGKTSVISTGDEVSIKGIKSVNKNDLTLTLSNGQTVSSNDIKYADDDTASLYGLIASQNVPTALANRLTEDFKGSKTEPVDFVLGASEAYNYGKVSYPAIPDTSLAMKLPESLRKIYYNMGKMDAITSTNVAQQKVEAKKSDSTQRSGKVHMDGITNLTARQKVSLSTIARVTNDITHNDVYIYESVTNAKGERVLKNDVGSLKKGSPAPNGMYMNGNIYLDVNAGNNGEGVMLYAFAHELTHDIKENSPAQFKKLADFVVGEMYKSGTNLQELIRAQQKKARGTMSFDDAYEEVIADSMEKLFTSTDVVERMERLKNTDKGLWDRIKSFFKKLYARVKTEYKGLDAQTREGQIVGEMKGALDKIADLFAEGVVGAGNVFSEAETNTNNDGSLEFSLRENENITKRSVKYFDTHDTGISDEMFNEANNIISEMVNYMSPYLDVTKSGKRYLPEEILGRTIFKNGSYGRSIENTTICFRTLAYIDFTNEIKEKIGRPLTVEESFLASQMLYEIAKEPQCLYCYVSLDRKAYDGNLLEYIKMRDKVLNEFAKLDKNTKAEILDKFRNIKKNDSSDIDAPIWNEFIGDKKQTYDMKKRFISWINLVANGKTLITNSDLTTEEKRSSLKNSDLASQINDAERYAQNASQAKKLEQYRSYNGEILKMSSKLVETLNDNYGLRFYSFSEYTPAFIVENMQQIRDASLRKLYGLAYTKKVDFAKIFAPTGMNINISVFGSMKNGKVVADTKQGADWNEVKELRKQYKNVGAVFVATNDEITEWALAQDWIDVVIPFHIVRTGANVAEFYNWVNNTRFQADYDESHRNKTITPAEHHNDRATFDRLIKERGLKPRFEKFIKNPNYMKLVNETRLSDLESVPLQPNFTEETLTAAKESFDNFVDDGGYYGDWYLNDVDYAKALNVVAEDVKAGKRANEVTYGRQDIDVPKEIARMNYIRESGDRSHGVKFSERRIVDENGKDYGMGVYLDSERFNNLSPDELKALFIDEVRKLGHVTFVAHDEKGNELEFYVVSKDRFVNSKGKRVQGNRDLLNVNSNRDTKKRVVLMLDEVVNHLNTDNIRESKKPHGMIDNYGQSDWEYYKVFVQERSGEIYSLVLNITTDDNGIKVLYDINKIEKIGQAIKFATSQSDDRVSPLDESVKGKMSERTEATDTRTLLANALETTAQNDIERKYIAEYKQDIQKMNEAQNQLADIRSEIRELTFAKGKRDTAKIKSLQNTARKLANKINIYDKQLLRLEATKPLKSVIEKERDNARRRAELKGKKMLEEYRQSAKHTALVSKIEAVAYSLQDRLLHPSAKTVIPEAFAGAVSDFLSALDFSTFLKDGTLRSGKANMKRADMRKALERLSKSLDGRTIEDDYGQLDIAPEMIEWLEYMKNALDTVYKTDNVFVVRQMSSEDLDRLYKTIKSLQTTVNNATKFYTNATRVDKLASDTIEYLKPLQGKAHSTRLELIDKTLRWDYAQPVTVFERFGTSGDTIMKMLMKGQKVEADNLEDIRNYVETAYTEEEVRAWRDEEKTVTIGDKEYKVTTAYLMELHNLLRDPDANRHILQGGGIRFDDLENGKKVQRFSDTFISQTDADKIEKMLTPRQKEVAESLEKFMADKGAEWANAISMVRFGYHAFGGITNYYPIKTIKAGSEYEAKQKRANIYALLNKSFTKERNINANNAIIVGDIFKTFNNHMSEMALYNAWALPVIDTIKWFNYREGMDIEQGKSEVSVKESLRQAFGKNADEYIRRLLESINSQRSGGLSESIAFKSLRMVNRVAVAGNIRVAVQQPFSITRALEVVPARYLKPIVGKARQSAYDEMVKYSSFGKWKGMGYYDVDVSRPLETTILKNASVADKVTEKTMKLAEDGDAFTWANLWNACKKWMSEKYSGEELINKTAEKFDEVILKTQVVDSVLVKSQWMRSDSFFHRMTSSFMSEPMTSYNALLRRFDKLSSDSTKYGLKSAVQMSGKAVAMSTAIFILTQLVNALATAPIDAMRDDDDYETYVEKLLGNFKDNAVQNLIPTNMMPYVSDIVEYAIYGKTDRPDLQIYTKVIDLGKQISGTIENYSVPKLHNTIKSALSVGSSFSGLPVSNITRDAVAVYNTVVGNIGNGELKFQTSADSSTVAYDKMYDAMSDGDENTMMKLYSQLKSNLVSDSSIKEGLTKRAKESYLDGDMTEDEAKKQLVDIANLVGMDSSIDDAYWTVNKWDYVGENGSTEDYSKYNDFCEAVETGKDLKNVIKTYTDNGVSKETLASQITSNFKPRYVTMTTKEKANLKGYLLNAYQLLGYDRAKKSKDIDKWK